MASKFPIILDSINQLTDLLVNNQLFDEKTLSNLMKDIDENDRETKLKRIIENIERRDREDIDKFAILVRNSQLFNEQFFAEDEYDSSVGVPFSKLVVRFKDLLSSPKACGQILTVTKATKIKSTKHGDVYNMTSRPRGFCIIIDNQLFDDPDLSFRTGSRADADRLSDVFSQLGFSIFRYVNQTVDQMENILRRTSNNSELLYHDALAVVILSHGITDAIYGSDGLTITVESILNLFNNQNCRLLIGKPKMFFLSACRGGQIDYGTNIYADSLAEVNTDSIDQTYFSPQSISLPTWGDVFVYYSTISGYVSLRNVNTGSWFGYVLAHTIAEYAHREHLNDLVTVRAGEKLQERESENHGSVMKQAIESHTRGYVKKLYFNPGF